MKKHNNIEKLFRDKLQNIEANPGANAWANVQVGISSAPAAAASASSWISTAIVAVTITAVAVGGYFLFNKEGEKKTKNIEAPIIQSIDSENQEETKPIDEIPVIDVNEIKKITPPKKAASTTIEEPISAPKDKKVQLKEGEKKVIEEKTSSSNITEKMIDEIIAEHQASLDLEESLIGDESLIPTKESKKENQINKGNSTNSGNEIIIPKTNAKKPSRKLTEEEKSKLITDKVIFPNVFSPGADGKNDIFILDMENSIQIDNIKVSIFDKTGKLVNDWSGLYNGWDGKYKNGRTANKDSYIYKAIILKDNKEYLKVNSFTLY
ncbi:MAG: gliding motility-associated C-terminal domain-containing protein [Flavobacteriales bacterium]|nr:gliding motility-associated C-terminal domain-containing protein [Flavobacteriales bacterium]